MTLRKRQNPDDPLVLRLATLADLPKIVAIYNATIPSRQVTADLDPVTVESRLDWFEAHQCPDRPLWVVETAEQSVAGWLSVSSFYGRPAYIRTAEISLYIEESMRGCGLGSFLLGAAIAQAPNLNLDRLLAFVFGHNQLSLALFTKFGFQRWGMLPGVALLERIERDLIILGKQVSLNSLQQ